MTKRRTPTIPNKCPICGEPFQFGRPNKKVTAGEVMEVIYKCGGHVSLYRFPEGWRLDIFECKEQNQPQKENQKARQTPLFDERPQGG